VGILPPALTFNANEHSLSTLSARAKKQAKSANNGFYLLENHLTIETQAISA
jgi:hypothetical protein